VNDLGEYIITDNQQPFVNFTNCGGFVGMVLDTGFHLLHFIHDMTPCVYDLRAYMNCQSTGLGEIIHVDLAIGEQNTTCLDTSLLSGPVSSLANLCIDDSGTANTAYTVDGQWCVTITGLSFGQDTLCFQLCNAAGQCVNYTVYVNIGGTPSDSLLAVPDKVYTLINTDVEIPILANDIVKGIVGNRFALADVEILTQPSLGTFGFSKLTGLLTYSPGFGACGVDSFTYRITDSLGQQSTTTITVVIACEKVLVFNGISPNGDGKNDTWHILGIEQYPANEVYVFNRWGNQVFEQKGYTNSNAWDGTWNGKDLPDGTYFYILNLGGNLGKLEGYLQILR
jgi:gliding motility-associated-like protein